MNLEFPAPISLWDFYSLLQTPFCLSLSIQKSDTYTPLFNHPSKGKIELQWSRRQIGRGLKRNTGWEQNAMDFHLCFALSHLYHFQNMQRFWVLLERLQFIVKGVYVVCWSFEHFHLFYQFLIRKNQLRFQPAVRNLFAQELAIFHHSIVMLPLHFQVKSLKKLYPYLNYYVYWVHERV